MCWREKKLCDYCENKVRFFCIFKRKGKYFLDSKEPSQRLSTKAFLKILLTISFLTRQVYNGPWGVKFISAVRKQFLVESDFLTTKRQVYNGPWVATLIAAIRK